jgi:site-specific DNA recombinase
MTKLRAAIYIRVSTEEQAVHGFSLAEQKKACSERAAELGAVEVIQFADEGVSGAALDRPGLTALREAVNSGMVNILIIRDPDRLSRKLSHQLFLSEEFEKAGVQLEFLDFEWKTTPEGRLFYSIKGAIAEYEREKIRERVTRGKLQKARQGGIPVNFDVYGYRYNPITEKVSLDEEEAAVVRKMFQWFISEDIGISRIASRLNEMQIPTRRRAGQWHRQVVRQVLTNPVFKGEWKYGKKDWHTGLPRPPESVITIPVPAIIDQTTWEMTQDKMQSIRRFSSKKGKRKYLLTGLLTCADCGNTMGGSYVRWWGKAARRYTCQRSGNASSNQGCSPLKAILAEPLEGAVWSQVKVLLWDPAAVAREMAVKLPGGSDFQQEVESINRRLGKLEKGRMAIVDGLAMGLLELNEKTEASLADLKRSQERLNDRKRELEALLAGAGNLSTEMNELYEKAVSLLTRIDDLEFEDKRTLIRTLVSQITVAGRHKKGKASKSLDGVAVSLFIKGEKPVPANISRQNLS